jgi:hypothetical protein
VFKNAAESAALRYLFTAKERQEVQQAPDAAARHKAFVNIFAENAAFVDKTALSQHFKQEDMDNALAVHKADVKAEIDKAVVHFNLTGDVDADFLTELGIKAVFKFYNVFLPKTGVVIAGYGDHDYFPSYHEYDCYLPCEPCLRACVMIDHKYRVWDEAGLKRALCICKSTR